MAFLSGAGREEEFGSGGKILRGRRHLTRFSPYNRPSSSSAPLALLESEPKAGRSPSWFRGLISGAGKLISSVLGSEGSGSSTSECSSNYSSDGEFDLLPDEHEDRFLSGFNKRECLEEGNVEPLAIVSKNESKLIIEQLLLQETFTREEYSKLMEILQSRVLDITSAEGGEGIQKVVSERFSEKRPWQSLNLNRNISGPSNVSPSNLSAFSPEYYVSEAVTPDLLNRAAIEAKNWLEEKKLSPRPICDQEYGPCRINTDMNQHCFYSDGGSPIEMAKSYMQSLPPWRSPSFSTTGFKNPTSSGKHSSFNTGGHSLLASKAKTRDYYSSIGSLHSSRVPPKLTADDQGSSKLKPLFEVSRTLSATTNFGNKIKDSSGGDIFSDDPLRLNRDVIELDHLMNMNEAYQGNIVAFKEAQEIPKISAENVIEHLHSDIDIPPGDADIIVSDKNQDAEMPVAIEEQTGSISAPHDSLFMSSMARGNDGHSFSETKTFHPVNAIPAEPSIRRSKEENLQTDIAIKANHDSDFFKHADSITDSQPTDDNPHNPKETIRAVEETNTNGHFEENNHTNSGLESMNKGGLTTTNSSDGFDAVAASGSEGTHDHPSDVSSDIPCTQGIGSNVSNPQNGTKMKSLERVIAVPSQPSRGKRKAKKVVRQKRWKG